MRLPRFRLRTLLIVVAVVAVGFGLWHRSQRLSKVAALHRRRIAMVWMADLELLTKGWTPEKQNWHREMSGKYDYYAAHPWLPVPPDPPEPK